MNHASQTLPLPHPTFLLFLPTSKLADSKATTGFMGNMTGLICSFLIEGKIHYPDRDERSTGEVRPTDYLSISPTVLDTRLVVILVVVSSLSAVPCDGKFSCGIARSVKGG